MRTIQGDPCWTWSAAGMAAIAAGNGVYQKGAESHEIAIVPYEVQRDGRNL